MVSTLWKACSEGHLETVLESLKDASSVDIEIKDHTGVTPLIEAVKNGHVEIVRALLDKGADPTNGSSQGRPDQYTSDPTILELLNSTPSKAIPNGIPSHEDGYAHEVNADSDKHYFAPPPGAYPYYPTLNSAPPPLPEGGVYYSPPPPQPSSENQGPGGPPNLPPPEVARFIPCRYFPACRYGSSCLFAHPQGPYFQGPLPPPAQYPTHYDPMGPQAYPQNYYAVPPPSFQQPNGVHHMAPLSPPSGPLIVHARSGSEIVSPAQTHFSPPGAPPIPYGAMSPPYLGQVPVPMSIQPLPPVHHQAPPPPPPGPQSPPSMYNNIPPSAPPFAVRQDTAGQYPPQSVTSPVTFPDVNGGPKSPSLTQPDPYGPGPVYREGMGHSRRGSGRRGSFGGRKPPCLFFPAGRCKNGEDCRFPHVMPEGSGSHHQPYFSGRGGGPRPRPHINGNGFGTIEEKIAGMSVGDDAPSRTQNGAEGSSRSHSTDPGARPRFQGLKPNQTVVNGIRDKRPVVKQRVPNADEFPVLAGSTTPPARSPGPNGSLPNGNGHAGPTAAQVLQAPPPVRRDSGKESSTRGATPDPVRPTQPVKDSKPETNGTNGIMPDASHEPSVVNKLPISFAAVATSAAPDLAKEVSVSA